MTSKSWLHSLRRFITGRRPSATVRKASRNRVRTSLLERFEERITPAVTATWDSGLSTLFVDSTGGDSVTISDSGGTVTVDDDGSGVSITNGAPSASAVVQIQMVTSAGASTIDLSGIDTAVYTVLTDVGVNYDLTLDTDIGGGTNKIKTSNDAFAFNISGAGSGYALASYFVSYFDATDFTAGAGNDTFNFFTGGSLSGGIDAGAGSDKLSYSTYGSAVSIHMNSSGNTGIAGSITGFEAADGSSNDDSFYSEFPQGTAITFNGHDGNDTYSLDYTVGGTDDITISDTGGGNSGNGDRLDFSGTAFGVTVDLDGISKQAVDKATNYLTIASVIESATGTSFADDFTVDPGWFSSPNRNLDGGAPAAGDKLTVGDIFGGGGVVSLGQYASYKGALVTFTGFETVNLALSDSVTFSGTAGDDSLTLNTAAWVLDMDVNGTPTTYSGTFGAVTNLEFHALGGDDTLAVDSAFTVTGGNFESDDLEVAELNAVVNATLIQGDASAAFVASTGQIQDSVDMTKSAATITIAAGSYTDDRQIEIHHSATILGPNAAVAGYGARGPEAVIYPFDSDPDPYSAGSHTIVYVTADSVTFKGMTIDGDNPLLVSGVVHNGADVDAIEGISSYEGVGDITVQNNIIKNLTYFAVDFYNYFDSSATSNNLIDSNLLTNLGGGGFFWGGGVIVYNNFYADVTNNKVTDARIGVQTGNFEKVNPGSTGSIGDNTISVSRRGIFHNLHYSNASALTIDSNTITAINDLAETRWDGIMLSSFQTAVDAVVTDNIIDGTGANGTVSGYEVWNTPTTAVITISGGSVTGVQRGVWVTNLDPSFGDATSTNVEISGVDITATVYGVFVEDNAANANSAKVSATINGDTDVSSNKATGVGVFVSGSDASALIDANDNSISGNFIGIDVNAGSATISSNHIFDNATGVRFTNGGTGSLTNNNFDDTTDNGTDLRLDSTAGAVTIAAASNNAFAGDTYYIDNQSAQAFNLVGTGSTYEAYNTGVLADNFRIEDLMFHKLDAGTSGLIRWVASNLYVTTPGTGASDETIQRGVNAAAGGDTVNVEAGSYGEDVNMNSNPVAMTVLGAGAGTTSIVGQLGGANETVLIDSNQILDGFTITRVLGVGENNIGVTNVSGSTGAIMRNNILTNNRTAVYVNGSGGNFTIHRNVIDDNRTGILFADLAQGAHTITENAITNNRTFGVLFLDTITSVAPGLVITGNRITGNFATQLENGSTVVINASGNFWGQASPTNTAPPVLGSKINGTLPPVFDYPGPASPPGLPYPYTITGSSGVDYTPWLTSAADSSPATPGYQNDYAVVAVDTVSPQTGASGRINEGISLAASGGTVNILSGTYTEDIDGTLNAINLAPGSSPGQVILNGNVVLTGNDTLTMEVNGSNPATQYDNFVVTGGIDLGGATLVLAGSHVPVSGDVFTIMDNDAADSVTGTFNGLPAGTPILLNGQFVKVFYTGNDGNDVILAFGTPTITYAEDTAWTGFLIGQFIADADSITAGAQPGIYGYDAFSTVQGAVSAVASSGKTVVNVGTYDETVLINKPMTLFGAGATSLIAPTKGAQQTVITVDAVNVTIDGIGVRVNQNDDGGLGGLAPIAPVGIAAVGPAPGFVTDFDGLTLKNNTITSIGDNTYAKWTGSPSLTVRAAGIVLYDNAGGGIPTVTIQDNDVDVLSGTTFWQRAVWLAQLKTTFTGNTLKGAGNDLLFQFASGGASLIDDNDFNGVHWFDGGGLVIADPNSLSPITVSNNRFTPTAVPGITSNGLQVNFNTSGATSPISITGNTFTGDVIGIYLGNQTGATVDGNTFTPAAGLPVDPNLSGDDFAHVIVNSLAPSGFTPGVLNSAAIKNNIFNTAAGSEGSAVVVANTAPNTFGTVTIGGAGDENTYQAGFTRGVRQTGGNTAITDEISGATTGVEVTGGTATLTNSHLFANTTGVKFATTGTGSLSGTNFDDTTDNGTDLRLDSTAGTVTIGAASNNAFAGDTYYIDNQSAQAFDLVGTGSTYESYSTAVLVDNFRIEDRMYHALDNAASGRITVVTANRYVTAPGTGASDETIQRGINAADANDTVHVENGTYVENLIIDKPLHLIGQSQAGAKIVPALSAPNPGAPVSLPPGSSNIILVRADNVEITQLTLDGDNTLLTSGIVRNGADLDARNGIITDHTFVSLVLNLDVHDVTVNNIYLRGIYPSTVGGTFTIVDNTLDNIGGDPGSVAIFVWAGSGLIDGNTISRAADAIATNHSMGTTITDNTITLSGSGVHSDNNGDGGGVADVIQNNTISNATAGGYGVFVFSPYLPITASGNTITDVNVGMAAFGSDPFGVSPPLVTFSNNQIDINGRANSAGIYVLAENVGFGDEDVAASLTGNTIKGAEAGVLIEGTTKSATASLTNNQIHGNDVGVYVYKGATASLTTTDFDDAVDNDTDLYIDSTAGAVTIAAASNNQFAGDDYYIDNRSTQAFNLVGTGSTYEAYSTAVLADNFRIEDRMYHALDDAASGRITVVAATRYVTTPGTGLSDETIQRAVDAADAADTVHVEAGSFAEDVSVPKTLTIIGAGAGSTNVTGTGTGFTVSGAGSITLSSLTVANPTGFAGGNVAQLKLDNLSVTSASGGSLANVGTLWVVSTAATGGVYTIGANTFQRTTELPISQFTYSGVTKLLVDAGTGVDTINVEGLGATSATLNAGDGYDAFNLGSAAAGLDAIAGKLTLNGQTAKASISVDDVNSTRTGSTTYILTGATFMRTAMPTVTFANVNSFALSAESKAGFTNDIKVSQTVAAGGMPVSIVGGALADNILTSPKMALMLWNVTGGNAGNFQAPGSSKVTFVQVQNLVGSAGNDSFTYTAGGAVSTINGNVGFDTINAGALAATNFALSGLNTGSATGGLSLSSFSGIENLMGSTTGDDTFAFTTPTAAVSGVLNGQGGLADWLDFSGAGATGITANLTASSASKTGGITNIENVAGSAGPDVLFGNAANNVLLGQGGNDRLSGGDGKDMLVGGSGTDLLDGGNNSDVLYGGNTGRTLLQLAADLAAFDSVGLSALASFAGSLVDDGAVDRLYSGAGNDVIYWRSSGAFADLLVDFAVGDTSINV